MELNLLAIYSVYDYSLIFVLITANYIEQVFKFVQNFMYSFTSTISNKSGWQIHALNTKFQVAQILQKIFIKQWDASVIFWYFDQNFSPSCN